MSEGGERMCPLCAEEMDLTDQHLKPCKCGYEICVWCWHHIIDMAEKDETEGRCPACRTPYNKEKIVGMTANCEKLVSEMSVEKKLKSHKGKSKTSEGRKQLGSVRVIQRNLVYVVGLPLNFADEDLLQRKEYFGQYGKVLKVSISRTTTGAIQHFANSTCSVYITYSKEEEAIRCIQSVNGFILDGRPLKACFGTTKYCHAWLRNTPCSNPDCLYLHEIGSQEDSFTKDEVISAYTRSRVQQITGAANSMQRRSGNVLPPPADENCNSSPVLSGKLINKTATSTTQNSASGAVVSPPNSSSGRSAALPAGASWGTRSFNNQPLSTITPCSNGPLKPDACNGLVASSAEVASLIQVSSLQTDSGKKLVPIEENLVKIKLENLAPAKKESKPDNIAVLKSSSTSMHPLSSPLNQQQHGIDDTTKTHNNHSKMVDSSLKYCRPDLDNNSMDAADEIIENICSDFLSMGIHNYAEQKEAVTSEAPGISANMTDALCVADGLSEFGLGIPTQATQVNLSETEDDFLSFDNQRLKDPEVTSNINHLPDIFNSFHISKLSTIPSVLNTADGPASVDLCGRVVDKKDNLIVSASNFPLKSDGHPYSRLNSPNVNDVEYSNLIPSKDKRLLLGRCEGEVAVGAGNLGENSIISNILSMDFDSLDESLTSPQNLAKLLGETDKSQGSFGVSGSWKIQNSNQSRFSFAREEDTNQATHFGPSSDFLGKGFKQRPFGNDVPYSNSTHLDNDKFASRNNFPFLGGSESDVFANNHSHISSNKISVSRSQISAPPGFSAANRTTPPPGFSSYEKDQMLSSLSGNHILDASSFSRNQWQTPPSGNTFSNCDIEFMDPAILEVRHGTLPGGINSPVLDVRSSYSPQLNTFEEARLQSFLQRSLPPHTNQRINELGDGFSSITDAYGVRSRVMEQTLSNNFSPFSQFTHPQTRNALASNGQWNGWNEGPGANNLGVAELLRNERLGFNKLYGGYEDSKIRMPSSGNMYNGSYGF